MILVLDAESEVALWVGERVGAVIVPPYTAIGWRRFRDGPLVAGAVFSDFNGSNVEITAAADKLTRDMIMVALHYAFEQLCCRRVTMHVPKSNERLVEMVRKAGFVREGTLKDFSMRGDEISFRLLRSENRWKI